MGKKIQFLKDLFNKYVPPVLFHRFVPFILLSLFVLYCTIPTEPFKILIAVLAGALIPYFIHIETLKHTSSENKVQRTMETKKSIYFEATESFAKMSAMLANMTQIDIKTIGPDVNLIKGLQKIDLIAKIDLIEKVATCSHYYQKSFQEMLLDKIEIDNINNNAQYALDRHSEYLELAKLNTQDNSDFFQRMDECLKYHKNITKDLSIKMIKLSEKSLDYSLKFENLLSKCVPNIRNDIENGFTKKEIDRYHDFTEESIEEILKTGNTFLNELSSKIKKFDFPSL